jgi:hypothetical protein
VTATITLTATATIAAWQYVGPAGFSDGGVNYIASYVYNGTPYVAYQDEANAKKILVKKYNGAAWETVGSWLTNGEADSISVFVYNGIPYVSYADNDYGFGVVVKKYNSSAWELVGTGGFSAADVYDTSLFVDSGTPYVAYRDVGNGSKATVMKFNGSSWGAVGSAGISAGIINTPSLYVYGGSPYVAYDDVANGGRSAVMQYSTSWAAVGNAGSSGLQAYYHSLDVSTGTPYLASVEDGIVKVKKFTAGSWAQVGLNLTTVSVNTGGSSNSAYSSICLYGGIPYVAYSDADNAGKVTVKKYNGTSWVLVGAAGFSPGYAGFVSIHADTGTGTLYVSFKDSNLSAKAMVMKFTE